MLLILSTQKFSILLTLNHKIMTLKNCAEASFEKNVAKGGNPGNQHFPLYTQILDFSKLREFADNNFNFDEDSRKFSKWVEKTGGEIRETAFYEQFLHFSQCF